MNYKVTENELTSIADAIRDNLESEELLRFPTGFVDGVNNITEKIYSDLLTQSWGTPVEDPGYILFTCDTMFSLSESNYSQSWDGIIETSEDGENWTEWDGSESVSSSEDYKLYVRGIGNTYLNQGNIDDAWYLLPDGDTEIYCEGNIMNLLDYQTVVSGQEPVMGDWAFAFLFYGNSHLYSSPKLPAMNLSHSCYYGMFRESGIQPLPQLPATVLTEDCYREMFYGCSNIILSTVSGVDYPYPYRIPSSGTGVSGTSSLDDMFADTFGSFSGTPEINTTYYVNLQPDSV